jgi:predicted membrane protein
MKKVVIGIIIIMLGVFLLFNNLGLLPSSIYHLVLSWQMLLVAIGVIFLFDGKVGHKHKNIGILLIFIGLIFLFPKIFDVNLSGILIPLLLIIAGIYFVIIAVTKKDHEQYSLYNKNRYFKHLNKMPFEETTISEDGTIKRSYAFTGSKEKWNYGKINDVEIEAVFSGVELDFTQVELSEESESIRIKVESVFSGVILYVSEEWNIIIQKTGVFGDFVDRRPSNVIQAAKGKAVVLELDSVFGGGEIRCYE